MKHSVYLTKMYIFVSCYDAKYFGRLTTRTIFYFSLFRTISLKKNVVRWPTTEDFIFRGGGKNN